MLETENERLEAVARDSTYTTMTGEATIRYSAHIFERHFRGSSCLELGPAEGVMTRHLVRHFRDLTVVEGSETFADMIAGEHPSITVCHGLIEEFAPRRTFDTIVLGHVLEHVEDPRDMLQRVRSWLSPTGRVLAAVPNARSLHRQAAVILGILPIEHAMSEADVHHGHRRVYDPESLRAEFLGAGLRIDFFGGYWLKPVSNTQIEQAWTAEMLDAFMQLGERYPDIAGEIYVVATNSA